MVGGLSLLFPAWDSERSLPQTLLQKSGAWPQQCRYSTVTFLEALKLCFPVVLIRGPSEAEPMKGFGNGRIYLGRVPRKHQ